MKPSALIPVLWLAFGLRVARLTTQGLWYDEGWSAHLAQLAPWQALPEIAGAGHTHPPGYYLLLGLWRSAAGSSEFSLRFFSVACGLLIIVVGYRLAASLFDRASGVSSALVLAILPVLVVYSQEVRMYTLFTLAYLLLIYWSWRACAVKVGGSEAGAVGHRSGSASIWWGLALSEVLLLYTHYFALVVWGLVQGALGFWLWRARPASFRRWALVQGVVLLAYLPWAGVTAFQLFSHSPTDATPEPVTAFLQQTWIFFHGGHLAAVTRHPFVTYTTVWAVVALAALVLCLWQDPKCWRQMGLLVLVLVPLVVIAVIAYVRPGVHPRYVVMLAAPWALLVGRWLALWWGWAGRWRALAALLALPLTLTVAEGLRLNYTDPGLFRDDVRGLAACLSEEARSEDLVIFDYHDWAFEYYYAGPAPVLVLEGSLAEREASFAQAVAGRRRAYHVQWDQTIAGRVGLVPYLLERAGNLLERQSFRGLRLDEYALTGERRPAIQPVQTDFGGLMRLTGVSWPSPVPAGSGLPIALQWQATKPLAERYKVTISLADWNGHRLSRRDVFLVDESNRFTDRWRPGEEVWTFAVLPVPPATPPLRYGLWLTAYAESAPEGLDLLTPAGRPAGKVFTLGEVAVERRVGAKDPYEAAPPVQSLDVQMTDGLALIGVAVSPAEVAAGAQLSVLLRWRSGAPNLPDLRPVLQLVRDGKVWAEDVSAPAGGHYPISRWEPGEELDDWRALVVPPEMPTGTAELCLQVGARSFSLAEVRVVSVEHLLTPPSPQYPTYVRFGDVAELVGYDLPLTSVSPSEAIPLTLYWRAVNERPVTTGYTVFTHLLTPDGAGLLAQHDGPPASGRRPTTGWVQGEFIVDGHQLTWRVPGYVGEALLEVGLYDPLTGQRLPAFDPQGQRLYDDRFLLDQRLEVRPGR